MPAKLGPKMRGLKLLVISLGVLLLAGIGALVAAIVWRVNHAGPLLTTRPAALAVQRIILPTGAKVVGTDVNGDRLVVRVNLPSGEVRVLVFDLATGDKLTTIELAPTSP
jgi:hypothetical protein